MRKYAGDSDATRGEIMGINPPPSPERFKSLEGVRTYSFSQLKTHFFGMTVARPRKKFLGAYLSGE
jgi:hypothetical protein